MKNRSGSLAGVAILIAANTAAAVTWQIDPAHTTVGFTVRHLTISNVRGEFEKVSGTIDVDGDPTTARIQATIDPASIDTRQAKRDEHLRSADFLDVEHYPTMTFRSRKIEPAGADRWKVTGDLTLHGVTREVVLDVDGVTAPIHDPMGKVRAGAHATTRINRKEFGVSWNKALDGGGVVVSDVVDVSIDVEGIQQSAP